MQSNNHNQMITARFQITYHEHYSHHYVKSVHVCFLLLNKNNFTHFCAGCQCPVQFFFHILQQCCNFKTTCQVKIGFTLLNMNLETSAIDCGLYLYIYMACQLIQGFLRSTGHSDNPVTLMKMCSFAHP